ncbi:MAG: hypothetical protein D6718_11065 [Acidobacteria bacterium]|nr:MAG: hypothetical protein D6718_11065 [Acidobacteriota bacterium]
MNHERNDDVRDEPRLTLDRETVRRLTREDLSRVGGAQKRTVQIYCFTQANWCPHTFIDCPTITL